jgi:hypothetical protein
VNSDQFEREKVTKEIFQRLLVAMWLRPERALFDAHVLAAVHKFISPYLHQTTLEFGCLDGVPSFAMLGGVFADDYDDYTEVQLKNKEKNGHQIREIRPFDHFDSFDPSNKCVTVKNGVHLGFTYGTSNKQSHIEKAVRLNLYQKLWVQDFTDLLPSSLGELDLIYAPMLFWLNTEQDLLRVLKNFNNCTKRGGRLVTTFPKKNHEKFLISNNIKNVDPVWLRLIEAGIPENLIKTNKNINELENLFKQAGYKLEGYEEIVPSIISQVYQIGFRPFFPVLLDMRARLLRASKKEMLTIKQKWNKTLMDFILPLCETSWMKSMDMPNTWYVLKLIKI